MPVSDHTTLRGLRINNLDLQRIFGARSPWTREAVAVFYEALPTGRAAVRREAGRANDRSAKHLVKLAGRYGIKTTTQDADSVLLALQTYYALVVSLVASQVVGDGNIDLLPGNPFFWHSTSSSKAVHSFISRLTDAVAEIDPVALSPDDEACDLFKGLYQDLFPRTLRHELGEYYTPDWLAAHVLDQVGYTGDPTQRLLDPACGSGTFLLMALRRLRTADNGAITSLCSNPQSLIPSASSHSSLFSPLSPLPVGFDLNPLAVITARANYLIAISDLLPKGQRIEVPIDLCDSILGDGVPAAATEAFDFVVGNPPWIAWDNLSDADRQATKPLWEHYGLFSLSGNEARHGGGKKDLSMLMLYAAADRYLKSGGRLGMVITQTLFQTKGAGDGFRRFRLGTDGAPLKVLRVDDLVALRPFDAANWTSTIVLEKGLATTYPVPYYRWEEKGAGDAERGTDQVIHCFAQPVDPSRPNSPWRIVDERADTVQDVCLATCPYIAHLGANSGGANGVYWVELLGAAEGGMRIRNIAARGKHPIESIEAVIEPDLLFPLVRWSDVARFSTATSAYLILAQDPATRNGIDEALMRERYPRALRYLAQFRELLAARAAYRRYQGKGPFYSMYNVGPYTTAPIKVVWRRMDRQINAAVIEAVHDPRLGLRSPIPQETCVLVACHSSDEAHYLCAVLNSAIVNELVSGCSVRGGKGFGTPGMLRYIPLDRFDAANPRHVELALLSRRGHDAMRSADGYRQAPSALVKIQQEIDRLAVELRGTFFQP